VTAPEATLYVLCFSDAGPESGPHPVGEQELRAAFGPCTGWRVESVDPERIETNLGDQGFPAWLAVLVRA